MAKFLTSLAAALVAVAIVSSVRVGLELLQAEGHPRAPIGIPSPPAATNVYFAPLSSFSVAEAEALAVHYNEKFGITVRVLDAMPIPEDAFDRQRNQVIAERLIDLIRNSDALHQDPTAVVIGLTNVDMYIAGRTWKYAFSLRADDQLAVVSNARMDEGWGGQERRTRRLQKMVTKNLGILYYKLDANDDPGSVLYRDILGPLDLDHASEDF
jgi:predicted Zn-dependent protease